MTKKQRQVVTLPISDIHFEFYVRTSLDQDRVLQFMLLYDGKQEMPPLIVAEADKPAVDGRAQYTLVDGGHRLQAQLNLDYKTVEAVISSEHDSADLIEEAFKANWGGSKPPTDADIQHTLLLLIELGQSERAIMDRMPMPRSVTRKYMRAAYSTITRRKLQAAALLVVDKNKTIAAAAEAAGVDSDALRQHLAGKSKRQVRKGLDSFKGQLTQRFQSLANKNSYMLRKLLMAYEDSDINEKAALAVFAHLFKLLHQQERMVREYATRLEQTRARRKAEADNPTSQKPPDPLKANPKLHEAIQ